MTKSGSRNGIQIAVPAKSRNVKYNRRFARSQWRQLFVDTDETTAALVKMNPGWHTMREAGMAGSFRKFTGRTERN